MDALAKQQYDDPKDDGSEEKPDYAEALKESLKAFYDAAQSGDWDKAAKEFADACEHCEEYEGEEPAEEGPPEDGKDHHGLAIILGGPPHKG